MLCTYLSAVLLGGPVLNATLGWGWADPVAGLVIAAVALKEGRDAWRGEGCAGPPIRLTTTTRTTRRRAGIPVAPPVVAEDMSTGTPTPTSDEGHDSAPQQGPDAVAAAPSRGRAWLVPAGLALTLCGLLGGLALGRGLAADGLEPVTDTVSLGFARDMGIHHAQAVQMSEIVHRRTPDPALNYLAFDILSTQQGQIGIMSGWLELWGQSQRGSDPQMAWMGHAGPMPGMATQAEVQELGTMPVAAMEEHFLRLMIRHHRAAVPMADAAAQGADSPEIANFAGKMSIGQQSEIDLMQDLLRQRGLEAEGAAPSATVQPGKAPAPSGAPSHGHG